VATRVYQDEVNLQVEHGNLTLLTLDTLEGRLIGIHIRETPCLRVSLDVVARASHGLTALTYSPNSVPVAGIVVFHLDLLC
jgi:hypothetical protein